MKYDERPIAHDPEWRGPLKNRSCTDIPCLLIFVVFVVCWIGVGVYALTAGDLKTLLAPTDSQGRRCGVDSDVADKPYLLFFDLTKCANYKCRTPQVCLKECPRETWYLKPTANEDEVRNKIICIPGVNVSSKSIREINGLIEMEACAPWYLQSAPIVHRCFPTVPPPPELVNTVTSESLQQARDIIEYLSKAQGIVDKITSSCGTVIAFIAGGALMCIIYMLLLKWLALPCVWIAIIGVCGLFAYLAYLSYESYSDDKSNVWLALTIIFGGIAGIILLISVCLWQRIYLACQLIKEASKAVMSVLASLFFPILPWLIHLGVLVYAFYALFCLISIGDQNFKIEEKVSNALIGSCICPAELNYTAGGSCDPRTFNERCRENGDEMCVSAGCRLDSVDSPSYVNWLYLVHIIGSLWVYFFVSALGDMTLAATFATWYWTFHKRDVPFFTVTISFWRTIRYHLGTVAFGSFLITIVRFFRLLLEYIHAQSMRQEEVLGTCAQALYRCTQCLMAYLERFLRFMNRNAYIVCAVYGKGLCASAADAISLLMRNILRVLVLNKIVDWLLFAGKILVTCAMVALTWWYYRYHETDTNYWWAPVVLVGIGSYLVASVFFSVHAMAVDTIFLCFLEDCERHDGSAEKPYYMTRKLAKLLHLKNQ